MVTDFKDDLEYVYIIGSIYGSLLYPVPWSSHESRSIGGKPETFNLMGCADLNISWSEWVSGCIIALFSLQIGSSTYGPWFPWALRLPHHHDRGIEVPGWNYFSWITSPFFLLMKGDLKCFGCSQL